MAGHSKWANIQHRKSRQDAKRARIFSKLVREITVATRLGGPDPDTNPRLRSALRDAKDANLPADNIERAIERGSGEAEGAAIEEVVYEGYGPGGVAIYVEGVTDNKNRTAAEIRHLFSKGGGSLGESGTVAWQFTRRSLITVPKEAIGEVRLTELLIEVGAEDYEDADDLWIVTAAAEDLHAVADAIEAEGIEVKTSQWIMEPQAEVGVDEGDARAVARLVEALDDHDDVQKVWTNAPDEVLELELEGA